MEGPHVRPGEAGPMFVKKLWQMIRHEDHSIIDFTPDGAAFQVYDLKRLESEVLPKYFRHSRYQSFVRQLNLYGFNKTTRERHVWIYRHEFFHRDHPDWLDKLRRKGSEKSQRQSSPHGSSSPYADSGMLLPVGFTDTSPTSGAQYVMPDHAVDGHVAHAVGAACGGGGGGRGGDGRFEGFERVSPMGCGHVEGFGDVGRETRGVDAGAAGSASAPRVMSHFDSQQPIGGYISHGAGDSQWDHAHTQMLHMSVGYAEGQPHHPFTEGRPAGGMTSSCTPSPHNPEISAASSFSGAEGVPGGAFEGFSCELLHGAAYGSLSTASPHHGGPTHGMQATSLSIDSMLSYDVEDERMTRSASDMSNSTTDSAVVDVASGFPSTSPVGHTGSMHMQHGMPGFPPVPMPASVVSTGAHSVSQPPASYHYPHHHQQHHQQQQHQHPPPPPPPPPPRPQHHHHHHPQQQQQQQQQPAQAPYYSTTTFRSTDGSAFPLYENTLGLDQREGMHKSTGHSSVHTPGFPGFSPMPTSSSSPHSFPAPALVHRSSSCSSSTSCGNDGVVVGGGGSGDGGGGGYGGGGGGGSGFASSPAAAADVKPSAVGYWASIPPTGYQSSEPAFSASPSTSGSPTGMDAAQVRLPPTAPRIPAHGEGDLGGQWVYLQHLCTRHADVLSSAQLPRGLEELLVFCVRTNPFYDRHDLQQRLQCALEQSPSLNHDMQMYRSGMMSSSSSPTTEPPLLHVFFGNLATGLTRAREMCRGRGGPIVEVIDACARVWMGVSSSYL